MLKKLLVLIFILAAQSLFAYNCTTYADRAKKAALAASALDCGFTGNRWLISWQPHFNWCSTVALGIARQEDRIRTNMLRQCALTPIWITQCNTYAYRATRQYTANYHLGCSFTGARWHINYDAHLNWCETASLQTINNEDAARRNSLGWCLRRGGYYEPNNLNSSEHEDLEVDFDNDE